MVDEFEQSRHLVLFPGPTRGFLVDMKEYFPSTVGVWTIRKGANLWTDMPSLFEGVLPTWNPCRGVLWLVAYDDFEGCFGWESVGKVDGICLFCFLFARSDQISWPLVIRWSMLELWSQICQLVYFSVFKDFARDDLFVVPFVGIDMYRYVFSWYLCWQRVASLLARMPTIIFCFGLSGCGMCHFDFGSHECFPHYDARFHFIATYLCGICPSICWNTIVTARLVL